MSFARLISTHCTTAMDVPFLTMSCKAAVSIVREFSSIRDYVSEVVRGGISNYPVTGMRNGTERGTEDRLLLRQAPKDARGYLFFAGFDVFAEESRRVGSSTRWICLRSARQSVNQWTKKKVLLWFVVGKVCDDKYPCGFQSFSAR